MRGASNNPLDSYEHTDRDSIGAGNEWNAIILPLHAEAKLQNWAYPAPGRCPCRAAKRARIRACRAIPGPSF